MQSKTKPQYTLKTVSLDEIDVPADHLSNYDEGDGADFVEMLTKMSANVSKRPSPIICRCDDDGQLWLIDGLARLKAAQAAGRKTIDVLLPTVPVTEDEAKAKAHCIPSDVVGQTC